MNIDLGILWDWPYDERFVKLLDERVIKAGKQSYLVGVYNLEETIIRFLRGELNFKCVLDRASDTTPAFKQIVALFSRACTRFVNDPDKIARANNKATMHLELISAGVNVPYTIVLSPSDKLGGDMLEHIGTPFVIKPAEGGGGYGVVLGAGSLYEVVKARETYSDGLILLQEEIIPQRFDSKICWFRVFYACGKIIPCFWDPISHLYTELTEEEKQRFSALFEITNKIHCVCGLNLFSTEIALAQDGRYVVVDYVNDQCDMRFQSDTYDGVPDAVINEIIDGIVNFI